MTDCPHMHDGRYCAKRRATVSPGVCIACAAGILQPASTAPRAKRPVCAHLGQQTGWRDCQTCRGKTRLKIYSCAVRGECVLTDCATCKDRHNP